MRSNKSEVMKEGLAYDLFDGLPGIQRMVGGCDGGIVVFRRLPGSNGMHCWFPLAEKKSPDYLPRTDESRWLGPSHRCAIFRCGSSDNHPALNIQSLKGPMRAARFFRPLL